MGCRSIVAFRTKTGLDPGNKLDTATIENGASYALLFVQAIMLMAKCELSKRTVADYVDCIPEDTERKKHFLMNTTEGGETKYVGAATFLEATEEASQDDLDDIMNEIMFQLDTAAGPGRPAAGGAGPAAAPLPMFDDFRNDNQTPIVYSTSAAVYVPAPSIEAAGAVNDMLASRRLEPIANASNWCNVLMTVLLGLEQKWVVKKVPAHDGSAPVGTYTLVLTYTRPQNKEHGDSRTSVPIVNLLGPSDVWNATPAPGSAVPGGLAGRGPGLEHAPADVRRDRALHDYDARRVHRDAVHGLYPARGHFDAPHAGPHRLRCDGQPDHGSAPGAP